MKKVGILWRGKITSRRRNNMRIKSTLLVILLGTAGIQMAFPSGPSAETIEIKAATVHPVKHRLTEDAFKLYGKEIEKRTNGKVKFKWFLAGSLVQWGNAKKSLKAGLVDMVLPVPVYTHESEFPVTKLLQSFFLLGSASQAALAYYKAYETIPELRKEHEDLKPLGFFSTASVNIHTSVPPPKNLEDMNGLRMGVFSGGAAETFKALGAAPRLLPIQDAYMGVQRKMIDGVFFADAPLRSFKLTELISNHTMANFGVGVHFYAMNLKKWNSLPPDVQKVFEELTFSAGCLGGETLTNERDWVIEELKKRGDNFYDLPKEEIAKWKVKIAPVQQKILEEVTERGMDANAIFAKLEAIAEETRGQRCEPEDWWGRTGRKE
jgi:TRAP-type C4-dicarboxylate transport system substrate-binding protein